MKQNLFLFHEIFYLNFLKKEKKNALYTQVICLLNKYRYVKHIAVNDISLNKHNLRIYKI